MLYHICELLLRSTDSEIDISLPFSSSVRFGSVFDKPCIYCVCPCHVEPVDVRSQSADNYKQCIHDGCFPSGYSNHPMTRNPLVWNNNHKDGGFRSPECVAAWHSVIESSCYIYSSGCQSGKACRSINN